MNDQAQRRGRELLARAAAGEVAALSQLITALESRTDAGLSIRSEIHAAGGRAHIVGVTGAPGTGKSTLVAALSSELRHRNLTVGIVAVDPSSSLSGGAILGDRIRMQEHVLDTGIYVRSMSSRGWLGGVSRATVDAVAVLDAAGWDIVIVETVGVGQADVEIIGIAHTTVVVSVPGLGDDIQAIKAGLLEVADLHVVNKHDLPGADKTIAELLGMLTLADSPPAGGWQVPVLGTAALAGRGVPELADAVTGHLAWMRQSGELLCRERRSAVVRILAIAKDLAADRLNGAERADEFETIVDDVVARRLDPHAAAAGLFDRVAIAN